MAPKKASLGRKTVQSQAKALARLREISEERNTRQSRNRTHTAAARIQETSEERNTRQSRNRTHTAAARIQETSEERNTRQSSVGSIPGLSGIPFF
ncbi:Uncharacterised protein r2_g523 [Pycnogonum litorale]